MIPSLLLPLTFLFIFSSLFPVFCPDEYVHLLNARALLEKGPSKELIRPVVHTLLLLPFSWNDHLVKLPIFILSLLFLLFLWKKDKKLAILFAFNPFFLAFSSRALTEGPFLIFFSLAYYYFFRAKKEPKMLKYSAFFFSLSCLFRYFAFYLLIAPALLFLFERYEIRKKELVLSCLSFLAPLFPWMLFNYLVFGNPIAPVLMLARSSHFHGILMLKGQKIFSLPDRIPFYTVALLLLPGFQVLAFSKPEKSVLKALLLTLLLLELHGLTLHPPILRYAMPLLPLELLLLKNASKQKLKLLGILNLILSLALVFYFTFLYEKHVNYRKVGLFVRENCESVRSENLWFVVEYYVGSNVEGGRCFVVSFYDPGPKDVPPGYELWQKFGKILVYKRPD